MANLITLFRLLLLFLLAAMAYTATPEWQFVNAPLLVLIIALDGLDGVVARWRGESSVFGSIFDVAVDRIVENVMWIVLGHLGLVPIWVPILFIARGALVDSIRYAGIARGETAFGIMRSPLGRVLVAGKFMRGFYGTVKAATFAWLLFLQPWPAVDPVAWAEWRGPAELVSLVLIYASVALCLIRGVPVVAEFVIEHRVFGRGEAPAESG